MPNTYEPEQPYSNYVARSLHPNYDKGLGAMILKWFQTQPFKKHPEQWTQYQGMDPWTEFAVPPGTYYGTRIAENGPNQGGYPKDTHWANVKNNTGTKFPATLTPEQAKYWQKLAPWTQAYIPFTGESSMEWAEEQQQNPDAQPKSGPGWIPDNPDRNWWSQLGKTMGLVWDPNGINPFSGEATGNWKDTRLNRWNQAAGTVGASRNMYKNPAPGQTMSNPQSLNKGKQAWVLDKLGITSPWIKDWSLDQVNAWLNYVDTSGGTVKMGGGMEDWLRNRQKELQGQPNGGGGGEGGGSSYPNWYKDLTTWKARG